MDNIDASVSLAVIWDRLEDADKYMIKAKSANLIQSYETKDNKFQLLNLYPATEYEVAVKGINKKGDGSETAITLKTGMLISQ